MSHLMAFTPFAGFGVAFALAWILTPQVKRVAMRLGAIDHRSHRKIHANEVPRLGGIAIAVAFFVPVLLIASRVNLFEQRLYENPRRIAALLLGGFVILALGVFDDLYGATAIKKLAVQIPVGVLTWWAGIRIGGATAPNGMVLFSASSSLVITVGWIVVVTNAVNLIDGLDGLASGIALQALVATALCAWHRQDPALVLIALCLAGGVGGFLIHNFHPATIFMGDSGSLFLGYVLAAASIWSSQKSVTAVGIVLPVVVLAIPLLDTSLAIWRRLVTGRPVFAADLEHVHHRLLMIGMSQLQSVLLLYGVAFVFNAVSVILVFSGDWRVEWSVLVVAAVLAVAFVRFLGYLQPSRLQSTAEQRRKNVLLRRAVKDLEHKLILSHSDAETMEALAEFHDAIAFVKPPGNTMPSVPQTTAAPLHKTRN